MMLKYLTPLPLFFTSILAQSALSYPSFPNTSTLDPHQTPNYTFDELYNLTNRFLQNHMYPNNIAQSLAINSTLLSDDVLGRVDATRDYAGRELNTEYLFGLFANIALNPDAFTLLGYPINYTFTRFLGIGNVVSFAAIIEYKLPVTGTTIPQELDFWVTYNDKGEISQYDGNFRYLQWQLTSTIASIAKAQNLSSSTSLLPILHAKLANSICETATTFCNGTNLQYANQQACENHLYNETRFGDGWEWGMDTVSCRMIHQNMAPLRPDVHCEHIGPSGGGMCVDDRTYVGNLEENYFVNTPFLAPGLEGGVH
ncbi:hypothetical protein D6D12_05675 [Aureobasidium pullulans]|uniref:Uncharacterized protein n=1 Tax=Aureobasidium pullulans TaxID=5580 RepID=A0AB74JRW5_AURPU|nr:hypothetical protein D6D12_05675 [Aureobasidium pullulans]